MLYQVDLGEHDAAQAVALFWDGLTVTKLDPETREFANQLVLGCQEHSKDVDDTIRRASTHWRIERMARVDRNVIRMAVYELLHCDDIPRSVTINEAIEVARRFGDEGSPAFVNGILDRIAVDEGKQ